MAAAASRRERLAWRRRPKPLLTVACAPRWWNWPHQQGSLPAGDLALAPGDVAHTRISRAYRQGGKGNQGRHRRRDWISECDRATGESEGTGQMRIPASRWRAKVRLTDLDQMVLVHIESRHSAEAGPHPSRCRCRRPRRAIACASSAITINPGDTPATGDSEMPRAASLRQSA